MRQKTCIIITESMYNNMKVKEMCGVSVKALYAYCCMDYSAALYI